MPQPRPKTPRRQRKARSVAAGNKAPAGRVIHDREQDRLADDVVDMLLEVDQANTSHVSREEQDAARRLELQFAAGLKAALTEQLGPQGIRCHSVLPDGENQGYAIDCRDRNGRMYTCVMAYTESNELLHQYEDWERRLVHLLCRRILDARAKYYQRAGLS